MRFEMNKSMKCLSIIMVMILMMLAACAQENTSNSGESAKTGIVGKWKDTSGNIAEFKSDGTCSYYGSTGEWFGNDVSGRISFSNSGDWLYDISGNNMTMTDTQNISTKFYFARM